MQNKTEQNSQSTLTEAGPSTPMDVHPDVAEAGVVAIHENAEHAQISSALQSAHPSAQISKDAVAPLTQPTPNLVRLPEKAPEKPRGDPFRDKPWGLVYMARKLKERFERKRAKGELPNAA